MKTNSILTKKQKRNLIVLLVILLSLILFATTNVFAQETEWKLNSISWSTGETPLTSGNTFSAVMSKDNVTIIADYNDDLGEIIYFYSPEKSNRFSFGPSGGEFKNTFWAGPITQFVLLKRHLTILNWVGWSLGDPEDLEGKGEPSELKFCFAYHQATISAKGFDAYYANQIYQKNDMEHIFGLKKTFNLSERISLCGGLGYMLNAEKFLWSTGLNYNFKK